MLKPDQDRAQYYERMPVMTFLEIGGNNKGKSSMCCLYVYLTPKLLAEMRKSIRHIEMLLQS
jgi:hypothetical protein